MPLFWQVCPWAAPPVVAWCLTHSTHPCLLVWCGGGLGDPGGLCDWMVVGSGVFCLLTGRSQDGWGHVMSLSDSGQNSRILSYRYHCLWWDSPAGLITVGSWCGMMVMPVFNKTCFFSCPSDRSLVYTTLPGL